MNISPQPKSLEELEIRLLQSVDRLDRGEGVDGEEVFRRLRKRVKESRRDAAAIASSPKN
jgi:hypothetical protein